MGSWGSKEETIDEEPNTETFDEAFPSEEPSFFAANSDENTCQAYNIGLPHIYHMYVNRFIDEYQMFEEYHILLSETFSKTMKDINQIEDLQNRIYHFKIFNEQLNFLYFQYLKKIVPKFFMYFIGSPRHLQVDQQLMNKIKNGPKVKSHAGFMKLENCDDIDLLYGIPIFVLNNPNIVVSLWFVREKTLNAYTSPNADPNDEQKKTIVAMWKRLSEEEFPNKKNPSEADAENALYLESDAYIDKFTDICREILLDIARKYQMFDEYSQLFGITLFLVIDQMKRGDDIKKRVEAFRILEKRLDFLQNVYLKTMVPAELQKLNRSFSWKNVDARVMPKIDKGPEVKRSGSLAKLEHCDELDLVYGIPLFLLNFPFAEYLWFKSEHRSLSAFTCPFREPQPAIQEKIMKIWEGSNPEKVTAALKAELSTTKKARDSPQNTSRSNQENEPESNNSFAFVKIIKKCSMPDKSRLFISGLPTKIDVIKMLLENNEGLCRSFRLIETSETSQNCLIEFSEEEMAKKIITKWSTKIMSNGKRLLCEYIGIAFREVRLNYAITPKSNREP